MTGQKVKFLAVAALTFVVFVLAATPTVWADEPATDNDLIFPEKIDVQDLLGGGMKTVRPDWEEINKHPLGSDKNPIRADGPAGQRAYLNRLICPVGDTPTFQRAGSSGIGPYTTIMDIYTLTCFEQPDKITVFMDLYHPGYTEKRPLPGFKIRP